MPQSDLKFDNSFLVKQDENPFVFPTPVPARPFTPFVIVNEPPPMDTPSTPPPCSPGVMGTAPLFPIDPAAPDPFLAVPKLSDSLDSNAIVEYQGETPESMGVQPWQLPPPVPLSLSKPVPTRPNIKYGVIGPDGRDPLFHSIINRKFKRYASCVSPPVDLIDPNADLSDPSSWQVAIRGLMNFENRRQAQKVTQFKIPQVPPPPKVHPGKVVASLNVRDAGHFAPPAACPEQRPPTPKMLPAMPPPLCASQSLPAVLPENIAPSNLPLPPDDTSMQSLCSNGIDIPSLSLEDPVIVPPPRSLENPLRLDQSMSCAQPEYDNMETNNQYFPGGWRPPPDDTRDSTDSIMDKIRTRP